VLVSANAKERGQEMDRDLSQMCARSQNGIHAGSAESPNNQLRPTNPRSGTNKADRSRERGEKGEREREREGEREGGREGSFAACESALSLSLSLFLSLKPPHHYHAGSHKQLQDLLKVLLHALELAHALLIQCLHLALEGVLHGARLLAFALYLHQRRVRRVRAPHRR